MGQLLEVNAVIINNVDVTNMTLAEYYSGQAADGLTITTGPNSSFVIVGANGPNAPLWNTSANSSQRFSAVLLHEMLHSIGMRHLDMLSTFSAYGATSRPLSILNGRNPDTAAAQGVTDWLQGGCQQ